jgi:hypothetical protein
VANVSDLKRVGDLEISQDLDFQRKEWRIQRIGWLLMLGVTVIALLGGCGHGLLARATRRTPDDALVLRYDRIARHQGPTRLVLQLNGRAGDSVAVWLDEAYVNGVQVRTITPDPERVSSGNGRITYRFAVQPNATITFLVDPDKFWRREGALGVEGGPSIRFTQFVLP